MWGGVTRREENWLVQTCQAESSNEEQMRRFAQEYMRLLKCINGQIGIEIQITKPIFKYILYRNICP